MVYVDDPMSVGGKFDMWCHLWADTQEELEPFARRLALQPSWLQHSTGMYGEHFWHYDISPRKRAEALRKGAQYLPLREWIKQAREKQRPVSNDL